MALEKDYAWGDRSVSDAQKEVLEVLEHDGYLTLEQKGYAFVSSLVRDWWRARHGFSFTPVLERGD